YSFAAGIPKSENQDLLTDRNGRLWVANSSGLLRLIAHPHPGTNIVEYQSGIGDGFPKTRVYSLFESSNGDIWAGMFLHLARFQQSGGSAQVWGKNAGLPEYGVISIAEDRDQNLWLGTADTGVFKLSRGGFTSYFRDDGLSFGMPWISETDGGLLFATARL